MPRVPPRPCHHGDLDYDYLKRVALRSDGRPDPVEMGLEKRDGHGHPVAAPDLFEDQIWHAIGAGIWQDLGLSDSEVSPPSRA